MIWNSSLFMCQHENKTEHEVVVCYSQFFVTNKPSHWYTTLHILLKEIGCLKSKCMYTISYIFWLSISSPFKWRDLFFLHRWSPRNHLGHVSRFYLGKWMGYLFQYSIRRFFSIGSRSFQSFCQVINHASYIFMRRPKQHMRVSLTIPVVAW